jgi:hypothetical protein
MGNMIKQLRIQHNSFFIKVMLLGGFLLSLFISGPARAQSVDDWISSLGSISFSSGGAAQFTDGVLQSLQNGSVSPVLQYVLLNNTMTQAIEQSLAQTPDTRLPYTAALEKFNWGICNLTKSFQTSMVLTLLPQTSANSKRGGSNDPGVRQAKLQQALSMATEFSKDRGCDNSNSNDSGFDSAILQLLQSL